MKTLIFCTISTLLPYIIILLLWVNPAGSETFAGWVFMLALVGIPMFVAAIFTNIAGIVKKRYKAWHIALLGLQAAFLPLLSVSSCQSGSEFAMDYGRVKWLPPTEPLPDSYTFSLHTNMQSYIVEKKGRALTLTAKGQYFTTPRELPRDQQKLKEWSFSRTLPEGDADLEQLIARVWQVGVCEVENELRVEAISCSMSLSAGQKHCTWDLVQDPVSQKLRPLYAALNERLFSLIPDAQQHPACFPMSDTPPPHVKGDSRGDRLWYRSPS